MYVLDSCRRLFSPKTSKTKNEAHGICSPTPSKNHRPFHISHITSPTIVPLSWGPDSSNAPDRSGGKVDSLKRIWCNHRRTKTHSQLGCSSTSRSQPQLNPQAQSKSLIARSIPSPSRDLLLCYSSASMQNPHSLCSQASTTIFSFTPRHNHSTTKGCAWGRERQEEEGKRLTSKAETKKKIDASKQNATSALNFEHCDSPAMPYQSQTLPQCIGAMNYVESQSYTMHYLSPPPKSTFISAKKER